jgi:hypothetical protein
MKKLLAVPVLGLVLCTSACVMKDTEVVREKPAEHVDVHVTPR